MYFKTSSAKYCTGLSKLSLHLSLFGQRGAGWDNVGTGLLDHRVQLHVQLIYRKSWQYIKLSAIRLYFTKKTRALQWNKKMRVSFSFFGDLFHISQRLKNMHLLKSYIIYRDIFASYHKKFATRVIYIWYSCCCFATRMHFYSICTEMY